MEFVSIGEFALRSQLSPKALRLYGELGLLVPARVDPTTGYRSYSLDQLDRARLIASLRQVGIPLADIAATIDRPDAEIAAVVSAFWDAAVADHSSRRRLVELLVARLNGTRCTMYEIDVHDVPTRHLLGMERHVADSAEVWAMGKEFIALFKSSAMPRPDGIEPMLMLVYYGEVNADSDGPVEVCRPIPAEHADALAAAFPTLRVRTEPAHREAVVELGRKELSEAEWALVSESVRDWASEHGERGAPSASAS